MTPVLRGGKERVVQDVLSKDRERFIRPYENKRRLDAFRIGTDGIIQGEDK
jgi:hypothetical protein